MNLKAKPDEKQEGTVVFSLITRKGNKANAKGMLLYFFIFSVLNRQFEMKFITYESSDSRE